MYNDTAARSVSITIAQKSISGAAVTLGEGLIYTGREPEQSVTPAVIDGLNAAYTVSGNRRTDAGTQT